MDFKEYEIEINGIRHTIQVQDGDPVPAGAKPVEHKSRSAENKSRTPQNKSKWSDGRPEHHTTGRS